MITNKVPSSLRFLLKDIDISTRYLHHPAALRNRMILYYSLFRLSPHFIQLPSLVNSFKDIYFSPPIISYHFLDKISSLFSSSELSSDPLFSSINGRKSLLFSQTNFDLYIVPMLKEFILPFLNQCYGDINFSFVDCQAWKNYNIESTEWGVYSENWHVDNMRGDALKLFIPFHDIDVNHGPTYMLTPADTKLVFDSGYINRAAVGDLNLMIDRGLIEPNIATCQQGSFYCFNPTYSLHRASIPNVGLSRSLLQLVFYPSKYMNFDLADALSNLSALDRYIFNPNT